MVDCVHFAAAASCICVKPLAFLHFRNHAPKGEVLAIL
jgi:hypothetical protein